MNKENRQFITGLLLMLISMCVAPGLFKTMENPTCHNVFYSIASFGLVYLGVTLVRKTI
jgi:hypothetical protein